MRMNLHFSWICLLLYTTIWVLNLCLLKSWGWFVSGATCEVSFYISWPWCADYWANSDSVISILVALTDHTWTFASLLDYFLVSTVVVHLMDYLQSNYLSFPLSGMVTFQFNSALYCCFVQYFMMRYCWQTWLKYLVSFFCVDVLYILRWSKGYMDLI